jgi:hypothetical protein
MAREAGRYQRPHPESAISRRSAARRLFQPVAVISHRGELGDLDRSGLVVGQGALRQSLAQGRHRQVQECTQAVSARSGCNGAAGLEPVGVHRRATPRPRSGSRSRQTRAHRRLAAVDTIMDRPAVELAAEAFPGVTLTREIGT